MSRESSPGELPGRPGEFRPEPPPDPDVNLSIHPARATQRKAATFHQDKGVPPGSAPESRSRGAYPHLLRSLLFTRID
jgi:hypothetical protein